VCTSALGPGHMPATWFWLALVAALSALALRHVAHTHDTLKECEQQIRRLEMTIQNHEREAGTTDAS